MSDNLRQVRLDKLKRLKEAGYHPYPEKYERTHLLAEAKELNMGKKVRVAGRIMLLRVMGKLAFAQLQDWSGRLQVAIQVDEVGEKAFKDFEKFLDLGDFIGIEGEMFTTHKGEISVLAKSWTFLGKALLTLPEKWHGLQDKEACHRERYLDLIMNEESKKRFQFRSDVIKAIREFYWKHDFTEVETPTLTHKATGANAKPYSTHNNALDIDLYLRISMELPHKMLITGGYDRLFEIGKAFRNEGIDPSHLPEHTHFEHYAAYWNYEDNMKYTEALFDHLFENIESLPKNRKIDILDKEGNPQSVHFKTPFARASFVELLKKDCELDVLELKDVEHLRRVLKEKHIHIEDMENMGLTTLIDQVYKKVSRPKIVEPTFVYDYPKFMQPLARVNDKDPRIVDQFQLVVNGWEVVKAYSELVDPIDQAERFADQAKAKAAGDEEAMEGDDEFIRAMEYGMPPISGWALGIDRIVTLFTQQENVRDCVLFPLMRPETPTEEKPTQTASIKNSISPELLNSSLTLKDVDSLPSEQSKRFIAILNKKGETGRLLNALGHMTAGLAGNNNEGNNLCFLQYEDKDGNVHPNISHYPFIVLKAENSNKIRQVRQEAIKKGIPFTDFTSTMTIGTSKDQMQATKNTAEQDLEYLGICLFGDTKILKEFTGKFSLFQ